MFYQHDNARRWRVRFSLRSMMLTVLIVSTGLLLWSEYRRRVELQIAREFVRQELRQRHWIAIEPKNKLRVQIDKDFSESGSRPWSFEVIDTTAGASFLRPSIVATELDAFEAKAISRIKAGAQDFGHVTWGGEVRYVQAVNMEKSCGDCHMSYAAPATPLIGRIAIVSVRASLK